jgi:transposase InsO family protein
VDGSHPLSETSAAACAKALTFTWISPFGVPETITSDHELQFTSNLWLQFCEMHNISHKQTTAYHPESNAAVKRLHHRLKDALRACAAARARGEPCRELSTPLEMVKPVRILYPLCTVTVYKSAVTR